MSCRASGLERAAVEEFEDKGADLSARVEAAGDCAASEALDEPGVLDSEDELPLEEPLAVEPEVDDEVVGPEWPGDDPEPVSALATPCPATTAAATPSATASPAYVDLPAYLDALMVSGTRIDVELYRRRV